MSQCCKETEAAFMCYKCQGLVSLAMPPLSPVPLKINKYCFTDSNKRNGYIVTKRKLGSMFLCSVTVALANHFECMFLFLSSKTTYCNRTYRLAPLAYRLLCQLSDAKLSCLPAQLILYRQVQLCKLAAGPIAIILNCTQRPYKKKNI